MKDNMACRVGMAISSVIIAGLGVGMMRKACFGIDPLQSFTTALYGAMHGIIAYGTLFAIATAVLLLTVFILNKKYIGLVTFLNMFGCGYVTQFFLDLINRLCSTAPLWVRIILMLAGVALVALSVSLATVADIGVCAYDAIPLILTERKVGKFVVVRVGMDFTFAGTAAIICLLSGQRVLDLVNVGTIVLCFCMGPVIALMNRTVSQPLLDHFARKQKA